MKIKYLKEAKNLQELKSLYFKLSKELHPDLGGDLEAMKKLNNEYDFLIKILPNKSKEGEKIFNENIESMGIFKEMILDLLNYANITIELIGSWLWVSGKGTFGIKDDILYKKYGFRYSKAQKKFYYFNGIKNSKGKRKGGFLEQARNKYDIYTFKSDEKPLLV